jgi:hypothetical protein
MIKKVNLENFDIKTKFSVPEQRENLTSGESINKSFGKIEKVIEDLKDVAFSGDYNDLINKPKPGTGSGGNANIDDTAISTDSTWSSDKIHKETAKWVGTREEFEKVKDTLEDNTIVYFTDDEELIIVNESYSKEEIDNKLSNKVDNTDFISHTDNADIHVSLEEKTKWNNKSDFNGSYTSLTDKPTIPKTWTGTQAEFDEVKSTLETGTIVYITDDETAIDNTIYELNKNSHTHSNKDVLDTITTDKVNEWDNKTSVTKVSELDNDSNYQTDTQVSNIVSNATSSAVGSVMNTVNSSINNLQESKLDKTDFNTFKTNVSSVEYNESTKTLKLFNNI